MPLFYLNVLSTIPLHSITDPQNQISKKLVCSGSSKAVQLHQFIEANIYHRQGTPMSFKAYFPDVASCIMVPRELVMLSCYRKCHLCTF